MDIWVHLLAIVSHAAMNIDVQISESLFSGEHIKKVWFAMKTYSKLGHRQKG